MSVGAAGAIAAAYLVADELGITLELGGTLSQEDRDAMSALLADCMLNVAERRPLSPLADRLMITAPLTYEGPLHSMGFSGGVSEYVYGSEQRNFGDLGIELGKAVADRVGRLNVPVESAEQMIRATVIGAGQYTLQVSGSTIYVSQPELLPQRNLQVVTVVQPSEEFDKAAATLDPRLANA